MTLRYLIQNRFILSVAPRYRFPPRGYYKPNYFNTYHKELLGQKPSWNYYDEHDYNGRRNPHLDFSHRQGDDYGYAKAYPYQDYQNNLQDEREATLPNLSGDDLDNITSTMSTASDNFNITASLLLHETATSTNDTLINVPLETKSTLSSNTTEVSRTTDNVTNNEETTKKVVIDDGEGVTIIFKRSKRSPIMIGLLSRLRAEKVNYSLPIVT